MSYGILFILSLIAVIIFLLFWNKPITLLYVLIIFCLASKFFITQLEVPALISYAGDLIASYVFIWAVILDTYKNRTRHTAVFQFSIVIVMLLFALMTFLFNQYSPSSFFMGLIKNYRFFMVFYSCLVFLNKKDVDRIYLLLLLFLGANVLLSSYQFFIQGLKFDFNGGFFGTEVGGNGLMNFFLVAVSIYAVVMSLNKKKPIAFAGIVVFAAVYISVLSELKIYFFEIAVIIVLTVLFSKFSIKTITLVAGSIVLLVFAIQIMGRIYPIFDGFFKVEKIIDYVSNDKYGGEVGNLNRATALSTVINDLLWTPTQKLFGVGLGNAGQDTDFYNAFGFMKYTWFFVSYFTSENGLVGLLLYVMFIISIAVTSYRYSLKDKMNREYYVVNIILAIMILLIMFYDGSLLEYTTYIYFILMALPFVLYKSKVEVSLSQKESSWIVSK